MLNKPALCWLLTTAFFVFIVILLLIKALHFLVQVTWLFRHGKRYADLTEDLLSGREINYGLLAETIAEMRRHTHVIVSPILGMSHRIGGVIGRVLYYLMQSVYRMPSLIVAVSLLGYWFGTGWQVTVGGLAVAVGIFAQVGYILGTWLLLGRTSVY